MSKSETVRSGSRMTATVGLAKARSEGIPELDGLRGLAIVSVMLFQYMADAPGYASFGLV